MRIFFPGTPDTLRRQLLKKRSTCAIEVHSLVRGGGGQLQAQSLPVLFPSPALEDMNVPLLLPPLRPTKLLQELGQEEKELRLCLAIHHRKRLLRPTKLQEERELRLRLAIHHRKRLLRPTKLQEERELRLRLASHHRKKLLRPTKLQKEKQLCLCLASHHRKRLLRPTKLQEEELLLRLAILQQQRVRPTKPKLLQHRELVILLRR